MTRKCALCKDTNYRTKYSFFSAPKDAELRKKWQSALCRAKRNFIVTDDTFVCSRHFDKNDIITHWVSGVPPHVITIEYKKYRLRPGAVPTRNLHSANNVNSNIVNICKIGENVLTWRKRKTSEETFLIPKKDRCVSDEYGNADVCYYDYSDSQDCLYTSEENSNIQSHVEDTSRKNSDVCVSDSKESRFRRKETCEALECDESCDSEPTNNITETSGRRKMCNKFGTNAIDIKKKFPVNEHSYFVRNETTMEACRHDAACSKQKLTDISSKPLGDVRPDNRLSLTVVYADSLEDGESSKRVEMLFEDFLDVCTEARIPNGWSCLVTSRGHSTTVVYLCMNITDDGLPFVEKQVFLKSDMIAHYAVINKEINPNLVKERKHNKVKSLSDVEALINEFDQKVTCQGIYDFTEYNDDGIAKVVYTDGLKWRHTSCPLIVSNDSSRCLKCTTLSRMLRKS